ncbi:MAG: 2-oxoacid:acceptor oxidoreductase family protein [Promethearchaeota archaeon]
MKKVIEWNSKPIEITFHGRGGQTAVTASQLLAEMAFEEEFMDCVSIPIIGAERRGAPIMAFTKISKEKVIKTYDSVKEPDFILFFDTSLLEIPRILNSIKEKSIVIANSNKPLNSKLLVKNVKVFIVDATGICIKHGLMHSSGPILNIPMISAFSKVSGFFGLNTIEKVLKREFGEKKLSVNMIVAKEAHETVKEA